jgi:cadmium resistance protein CadD (predicted permease)
MDFVIPTAVGMKRIVKSAFGTVNLCAVGITELIKIVHIAVVTALADFFAAVPRIPDVVHYFPPNSAFYIIVS